MSQVSVSKMQSRGWPIRRVGCWLREGWRMFRRAPCRLYGLAVLPMLVEIALQLGWPGGGVVASKLVVPLCSAWALLMAHGVLTVDRAAPGAALRALWRIRWALPALALLSASVFVFQCGVMLCLAGPAAAMAFVTADATGMAVLTRPMIALGLAAGAVPATALLFFAVTRVVLDRVPVLAAVAENLQLVLRNPRAMLSWMAANFGLLFALVYQPLILLVLLPIGLVAYAAWRDVFHKGPGGQAAGAAQPASPGHGG